MRFNFKSKFFLGGMALLASSLFFAGNSFASCSGWTANGFTCKDGGDATGIQDSTTTGKIQVELSPGVQIAYQGENLGATYAERVENMNVAVGSRNAYGFASTYSGYFQRMTDTAAGEDIALLGAYTLNEPETAFSGWTAMGGSSSSS